MKPFSVTLIALLITSVILNAQSVHFKVHYKPETTYTQAMAQTFEIKVGDDAGDVAAALKDQGLPGSVTSTTEAVIKTGKIQKDNGQFSFKMTITKSENNTGKQIMPVGSAFYGHIDAGYKMSFDSMASGNKESEFQEQSFEIMKELISQLDMPDTTLNIGDSVSVTSPVNIPIPGMEMQMTETTIYKLVSIENNIAVINVTQTYTSASDAMNSMMSITGLGHGSMLYDITNNFYKEFSLTNEMGITISMGEEKMKLVNNSSYSQSVKISKN